MYFYYIKCSDITPNVFVLHQLNLYYKQGRVIIDQDGKVAFCHQIHQERFTVFFRSLTLFTQFILVSILASCSADKGNESNNGFDAACVIVKEALSKNLTPDELVSYVADKLNSLDVKSSHHEVVALYHALFNADPDTRYNLFRESAEAALSRRWECDSIKQFYSE
jgi:hypothetical protein